MAGLFLEAEFYAMWRDPQGHAERHHAARRRLAHDPLPADPERVVRRPPREDHPPAAFARSRR
jgi:hypothetical protein